MIVFLEFLFCELIYASRLSLLSANLTGSGDIQNSKFTHGIHKVSLNLKTPLNIKVVFVLHTRTHVSFLSIVTCMKCILLYEELIFKVRNLYKIFCILYMFQIILCAGTLCTPVSLLLALVQQGYGFYSVDHFAIYKSGYFY